MIIEPIIATAADCDSDHVKRLARCLAAGGYLFKPTADGRGIEIKSQRNNHWFLATFQTAHGDATRFATPRDRDHIYNALRALAK